MISFRNDVAPILAKAGCSLGTCHGNKYGKGGFKLSLRSQDPDLDLLALTRDAAARRVYLDTRYPALPSELRDRASGSEDAFDAAVSALVMSLHELSSSRNAGVTIWFWPVGSGTVL